MNNNRADWDIISKVEYEALNTLQKNPSIIIKPADKGGAIVVMDREVYPETRDFTCFEDGAK